MCDQVKHTVAIVVGHNKHTGARAHDGTDEWEWNADLARALRTELIARGYRVLVLYRDKKLSYTAAMRKHASIMRQKGVDIALSLHFNAATPAANGFEFLHWWGSKKSQRLAMCLGENFGADFSGILQRGRNQGARSLWYHRWNESKAYSGRGGAFCYLTPCPAVICEPGFATNKSDWSQLKDNLSKIAESYADGIGDYFHSLRS